MVVLPGTIASEPEMDRFGNVPIIAWLRFAVNNYPQITQISQIMPALSVSSVKSVDCRLWRKAAGLSAVHQEQRRNRDQQQHDQAGDQQPGAERQRIAGYHCR